MNWGAKAGTNLYSLKLLLRWIWMVDMDKKRSRRDATANVTFSGFSRADRDIAGNGTAMCRTLKRRTIDVQNIAHAHIPHQMVAAARGPLSSLIH